MLSLTEKFALPATLSPNIKVVKIFFFESNCSMNGKFMEDVKTLFFSKKWSLVTEPGHEKWLERKLKQINLF